MTVLLKGSILLFGGNAASRREKCTQILKAVELTNVEKNELVAKCDHLRHIRFSPHLPLAFTEHGAIMLASVLSSPIAIESSVTVVRAFLKLREMLSTHKDLTRRLDALEKRYDAQFRVVFDAIRELMEPPDEPKRQIGFHP